ncbi:IclR family transcriptional regulator [Photobacterium aphoticum]|uniref:Transcriptional regulator n=1 Tax=Photobacterium aphoticum TaxID=754436 RepID=A0A0J1JJB0_9GAMM|nr:IclR family transcriptional regulator [Photobacterium aphoticum]KLV02107.1 transcriptional regulator [Photobacterium aphoticum]PSU60362.1 IclR family transcriptional regulator [Photobacterium aphoticum]GHA35234.1 IclR family transcriptional regulator [Photobacterium aphoticum]
MSSTVKRIQSVERAFSLLESLSYSDAPLPLQAISERAHLQKTTAHGLLSTLCALGYAERTPDGYTLGLRVKELAKPLEEADATIRRHFMPLLKHMATTTRNTAYLAIQSGAQEYLYVDAIEQNSPLTIRSPRGKREGLTTSAIGKVFLAFDDTLRRRLRVQQGLSAALETELACVAEQGFALDLENAEPGLHCLAIPLYLNGAFVAVAGISGSATILTAARLSHFGQLFIKDALRIR